MILDWSKGSLPSGELEDALGRRITRETFPRLPFWIDTETGELRYYEDPVREDPDNPGQILCRKMFLTPPVTVWLYT